MQRPTSAATINTATFPDIVNQRSAARRVIAHDPIMLRTIKSHAAAMGKKLLGRLFIVN